MRSDGENYLLNMKTKYMTPDERQMLANTVRVQEVPNAVALTIDPKNIRQLECRS